MSLLKNYNPKKGTANMNSNKNNEKKKGENKMPLLKNYNAKKEVTNLKKNNDMNKDNSLEKEDVTQEMPKINFDKNKIYTNIMISIDEIGVSIDTLNDKGLGRMYAKAFKNVLRYNTTNKNWFFYDGKVWKEDTDEMRAKYLAKIFTDVLIEYCERCNYSSDIMNKVYSLNSMSKRNTIINDAKCENPVNAEDFNKNIYLINLQNGTFDLRTFKINKHNPNDLISKICNVNYDPKVKSERWEKFINEIMEFNHEKVDYLQRILGYSLSGDVKEEELYIFYGPTSRNGKSTLLETLSYLLGEASGYSVTIDPSTFSGKKVKNSSSPSSDIARLAGSRLAITSELPQNMLINTELIKSLTGRDKITARMLYGKEFEFVPQFKLYINTNYLPRIIDDTIFASNRINVIEFNKHFSEEEQDKTLKSKLREPDNLSGILNWLLLGWKKANEEGMNPPMSVIESTNRFREECDKIGCFINECLERSKENITMKEVYDAYKIWVSDNGYAYEGKLKFKSALEKKGILSDKGTVRGNTIKNVIIGYSLKQEYQNKEYNNSSRPSRINESEEDYFNGRNDIF